MFVITADQVDSRSRSDLVASALEYFNGGSVRVALNAERTAGDELQVLIADAHEALTVILQLTRSGLWSVGCGVGGVHAPLPCSIREATGGAFVAARRAVERAKKRQTRFALDAEPTTKHASDAESLVDMLLALRARRSPQGWELHAMMMGSEMTQVDAAAKLGVSPQAVSLRARAAEIRTEHSALAPLTRILAQLDKHIPTQPEGPS